MSEKLSDVIKDERSYFFHSIGDGKVVFDFPTEFDAGLNDVTRRKIAAYANENSECWLGNINLYDHNRDKPILVKYEDQMVFNFEFRFVIPCFDEEIIRLIKERDSAPYTGTTEDAARVDVIFERLNKLGGIILNWV